MKLKILFPVLIIFGFSIAFNAQAFVCETNTMHNAIYCSGDLGYSWCGGGGSTYVGNDCTANEPANTTCPNIPHGINSFTCNACACTLTCDAGYQKCSGACEAIVPLPANCTAYNQCTDICTACNPGYTPSGSGCVAAGALKLGTDSVGDANHLFQSTNPALTLDSNNFLSLLTGNLGIGLTNPNRQLHLYNTSLNPEIDFQGVAGENQHWGLYNERSDNSLNFWGGSNWLTILRDGKVGIGTDAPGYKLDVNGTVNAKVLLVNGSPISGGGITSLNGLTGAVQTFASSTSGTDFKIVSSGTDHTFYLPTASAINRGLLSKDDWSTFNGKVSSQWTASGANIYFNNNVGIGTTSMVQKLTVGGTIRAANLMGSGNRCLYAEADGDITPSGSACGTSSGGITSLNNVTSTAQTFAVGTSGTNFNISSSGPTHIFNIPIASSTASGLLSSANWSTFNNKVSSQWTTSSSNIYYNNNVGIGTTSVTTYKLNVSGNANVTGTLTAGSLSGPFTGTINAANVTSGAFNGGNYSFPGNLGIGTVSPVASLGVRGTSTNDIFRLYDSSNNQIVTVKNTGKFGIGTASPIGLFQIQKTNADVNDDTASSSQLIISASTDKYLGIGYDATNNVGYLQALERYVGFKNLILQNKGGNVGIGVVYPQEKLVVYGNIFLDQAEPKLYIGTVSGNKYSYIGDSSNYLDYKAYSGHYFSTNQGEKLRITESGNVGIGTNNPANILQLGDLTSSGTATPTTLSLGGTYSNSAGLHPKLKLYEGNGIYGLGVSNNQMDFTVPFNAGYTWYINNAAQLTLNSAGNVGIGTTSPAYKLSVAGDVGATSFIYTSDRRLKKNIATLDNSLEKILKLRGVSFNWKENNEPGVGLIAQEVEQVFPELVSNAGGTKGIQYGNLVAPLIEAVKTQQASLEAQNLMIKELKGKIKELNNRLQTIEAKK